MTIEFKKSISDPVYGTVPLTKFELEIIDTSVFQRLRRVGQLGLASYVFPSADYSRFAHSIGACHTMGQMLEQLERMVPSDKRLDSDAWQMRRLAMLLHDVGHYFMSHATEYALEAFYEKQLADITEAKELDVPDKPPWIDHETVGKVILERDAEISAVLTRAGFEPTKIAEMFKGATDAQYWTLVSSELDADRLDYLMRSAQATGLPYGHFDRDYLLQSLTVLDGKVALLPKAIRAADHFVLCRSFDYLQVVYHKTIVGFEEMLKRCIQHLMPGELLLDRGNVEGAISQGTWHRMDDSFLMEKIRSIPDDAPSVIRAMRDRLVSRRPATLLWSDEELTTTAGKDAAKTTWHRALGHHFESGDLEWTGNCIYWFKHFRPTDATPFRTTYKKVDKDAELMEKSIHISDSKGIRPLTECKQSFTRHLSNQAYVMVRVYYVGPDSELAATEKEFKTLMGKLKFRDGFRGAGTRQRRESGE